MKERSRPRKKKRGGGVVCVCIEVGSYFERGGDDKIVDLSRESIVSYMLARFTSEPEPFYFRFFRINGINGINVSTNTFGVGMV